MRRGVAVAGAAILISGTTVLAFLSGGFFDPSRLVAGMAAWALVVVAAFAAPRALPASVPGRVAVVGLALLCVWTALSLLWAPLAGRAQDDLQRLLLYLGFFVAGIALLRGPGIRRWLEPSLVLGTLVVVGYGLSERLLPELISLDRSRSASGQLEQPITYWNGLGLIAAMGLVLAVRIGGDTGRKPALRAAAAAAGVPLALGVYLTFSRGALTAVAAGVFVMLALAPSGRSQLRATLAVLGPGVVAAVLASRLSTVESLVWNEQGDASQGLLMLVALVVLAAAAAGIVLRPPRRQLPTILLSLSRRKLLLVLTASALLVGLVGGAILERRPEGVSQQTRAGTPGLESIDTTRYRYWDVALETWADRPIAGIGSGGFFLEWRKRRDRVDQSGDAHSIYLETAAELGLVGVGALLLFLGGVAVAAARLFRVAPDAAVGLIAGLVVWAVHAGLDWDWEMPAVTLPALLMAAAAIGWSEELPDRSEADRGALADVRPHQIAELSDRGQEEPVVESAAART